MLMLIFHQTLWKENIFRYKQVIALQTAVTMEKFFSNQFASRSLSSPLLGLPSLQTNQHCSTSNQANLQTSRDLLNLSPPTNTTCSGGNVSGMMYRITPQLQPEGGAVADEKLCPHRARPGKGSVHSIRLSTS